MKKLTALLATAFALVALLGSAAVLTGAVSVVAGRGNSMEPYLRDGDLAVLTPSAAYAPGEVVAYRSGLLDSVVMHRVVAADGAGYTLQGDNNDWLDPEQASREQILGRVALRVPGGGTWLEQLTSPAVLSLMVFGLLAGGGTVGTWRRRRRRSAMPQHARPTWLHEAAAGLPLAPKAVAVSAVTAGLAGLVLGVLAWSGPATELGQAARTAATQSMTFDYSTEVPRSAAYDETTVRAPDPVFRRLADTVDVAYAYTGPPGTLTVSAVLSMASGWHSTVPLAGPITITRSHAGEVRLDLADLEGRANAAAEAIGIPATGVDVDVVPEVRAEDGSRFSPVLDLALTPLQLHLADPAASLTVTDAGPAAGDVRVPRVLTLAGRQLEVPTARVWSAGLLGAAVLVLAGLGGWLRRRAPSEEGAAIRSRHRDLLVPVHPMPTTPGRPVVDVTDFATLVKLAHRYGLLVMYWSRSGVDTFVVQDESTTFRYRTATSDRAPEVAGVAGR